MAEQQDSTRFRLLYDLGCAFSARIQLEELLPFVIDKCREAFNAEGASVLLLDREHDELYFPYVSGVDAATARRLLSLKFPAKLGVAGAVLSSGASLKIDDAQSDVRHYQGADQKTGYTTRNMLAAPLLSHQGAIGVVEVVNRRGRVAFSDADLRFLEALAGSIAIAIENARLYSQIKESEAALRTQVGALRRDLARHDGFTEMLGTAPSMNEIFRLMESAAASSITVLIEGETGTGKELVARGIHRASARAEGPFLAVNCAAMPDTLLESELFGHRRGAFTGAVRDNAGLFRSAMGGSVFLDEVGDMALPMQAKLLRVLEEEEVVPLGASFPLKVDVRVMSATNRDLRSEVRRGNFREDLYYRLAVFPVKLPPLRERREDIPPLALRFLNEAAERNRRKVAGFSDEVLELLTQFEWPGNVRQLQNEIQRAVAIARDNEVIGLEHLSSALRNQEGSPEMAPTPRASAGTGGLLSAMAAVPPHADANGSKTIDETLAGANGKADEEEGGEGSLREARAAFEARYIADVLRRCGGNVSRAAEVLGMSRVSLHRKVKDYGLR